MYQRFSFTSQNAATNFPSKKNGLTSHLYNNALANHRLNKLSSVIFTNNDLSNFSNTCNTNSSSSSSSSTSSSSSSSSSRMDNYPLALPTVAQQQQQRLLSNETVLSMISNKNNIQNLHKNTEIINSSGELLWNNMTSKFYPQLPSIYGSSNGNNDGSYRTSSLLPIFNSIDSNSSYDMMVGTSNSLKAQKTNADFTKDVFSSANLATVNTAAITANNVPYVFNDASSHSKAKLYSSMEMEIKLKQPLMPIVNNMNIFVSESPSFSPTSSSSNIAAAAAAAAAAVSIYSAPDFDVKHGLHVINRDIFSNMNHHRNGLIRNGTGICNNNNRRCTNKVKRSRRVCSNSVLLAPMTNIKCIFCSKVCLTRSIFHEHCQHHHKKKCGYCGKFFGRNSNLMEHIRVHTGDTPYKCTFCSKGFKQQHSLKDHIRTHTGEKPFGCEVCNKRFKVKHNLKVHMRVHTGEKPYQCGICNRKFTQKGSLNTHSKKVHP